MSPLPRTLSFLAACALIALAAAPVRAADERSRTPNGITVPSGFVIEKIAEVKRARELAIAPNGDVFVGTYANQIVLVPGGEENPGQPRPFLTFDEGPVAGVAIAGETMYIGAQFGVYRVPYRPGDREPRQKPVKIANLRPSGIARDHVTTTVAVSKGTLYASVGSSCDACDPELDATRATIQQMHLDGSGMTPKAVRIRNAIALAVNPQTGVLWAGVAGQDELEPGHPYEIFDAVSAHPGRVDYGWPYCYDNRKSTDGGHDCTSVTVPRVVFPGYTTPIGATFYPANQRGTYAFPAEYRGGAFVTLHGSWHRPLRAPRVVYVPMTGDEPKTTVNWNDPDVQWREFVGGFQRPDQTRVARPTGVAVGPEGSLFVADDDNGGIYRIRPKRADRP